MCATHVDLSWMLSIPNYFYATISAVLGALIGIGWTKRRYKREQRENEEKIRQSLLDCLTFNLERASQAREKLQSGGMPNFPMDATKLSSLILQAHGLLSAQLLRDLDWHRYQLGHITSKLSVTNQFFLNAAAANVPQPSQQVWVKMLTDSLKEHFDIVIEGTRPLMQRIEQEAG